MGGIFSYDPESGVGIYVDDDELNRVAELGGNVFIGLGIYTIFMVIVGLIVFALLSPFLTVGLLKGFIEGFVANNLLFFTVIGIGVFALKLMPRNLGRWSVRLLFDVYIVIAVLYVMLYWLRCDVLVYAILKLLDNYLPSGADRTLIHAWGVETLNQATQGNWLYELCNQPVGVALEYIISIIMKIPQIDASPLEASLGEMNILAALKTIGMYIAVGGYGALLGLLFAVVALTITAVVVYVPYAVALAVLITVNKLMFRLSTTQIRDSGKDYEKARAICQEDVERALHGGVSAEQAFVLFEKAAQAGNPLAQVCLASCYMQGAGTLSSEEKSFFWYQKAALQGNPKAQLMVAMLCFEGTGTKKNRPLAKAWLLKIWNNRDYMERQKGKQGIQKRLAVIKKKTRLSDCM